jgi:hypothetical protein
LQLSTENMYTASLNKHIQERWGSSNFKIFAKTFKNIGKLNNALCSKLRGIVRLNYRKEMNT